MKPEYSQEFWYWYDRVYAQSPSIANHQYDDEKMWEAWKAARKSNVKHDVLKDRHDFELVLKVLNDVYTSTANGGELFDARQIIKERLNTAQTTDPIKKEIPYTIPRKEFIETLDQVIQEHGHILKDIKD
jgi:hypothetical protein